MLNKSVLTFFCILVISVNVRAHDENIFKKEIVQIKSLKRSTVGRDLRPITFSLSGKEYHFDLINSDRNVFSNYLPIWLAKSNPGHYPNYTYVKVEGNEEHLMNGHFYVDNAKKAVFFIHYDEKNRELLYDGVFGENIHQYVVKSQKVNYRRLRSRNKQGNHLIYRVDGSMKKYDFLERPIDPYVKHDPLIEKLTKPLDTLYPKILVVVDNHLFKQLGSNIANTVKYIATFWNAVDQKYVELESPKIQILVTGIIIADDEKSLNYVYQNIEKSDDPESKDRTNPYKLYESLRMYFRYNFSSDVDFQNYDAVVLHTGLDTSVIAGLTYAGKICGIWYNNVIVADNGQYDRIEVAVHELAHMLNVEHDGKNGECAKSEDGGRSIMTPTISDAEYLMWSKCSKDRLQEFATLQASECLATRSRTRVYDQDEWF